MQALTGGEETSSVPGLGVGNEIPELSLDYPREVASRLRARACEHVLGRDEVIDLVLVAMLSDGHILLEDYPGSGKTTLAKALGESIIDDTPEDEIAAFRRVQFTPDLLPSDITGVMVFDTDTNTFQFRHGPVFAHVLLIDEINRTSPKVQAALLEAMAEKQVTVDNVSHQLDDLFFVIATQNPLDVAGTYPLPLAQIDRFLFKVRMEHIDRASELQVLDTWGSPKEACALPRVERREILQARQLIRGGVAIANVVKEALVDTARNLREDKRVIQGVSTRSLVQAVPALQTLAVFHGRDYVAAEDVEYLLPLILWHRVEFVPGTEDPAGVILAAAEGPLEALARGTLKRG
ncbi:MAG: AAA family ATPase [Deltaproteobacteria bacterium]|nr:AAA family ATPase [Deltaproteobacteria bacterium]